VPRRLDPSRSVQRSGFVLSQEEAGEAVLLDLAGERYFGLNHVGTRVWQLLEQPISPTALCQILSAEFDAPPERIQHDVLALLDRMLAAGLVIECIDG